MKQCLWVLTLFLIATAARAADGPEDCAVIDSERERLACYDSHFRQPSAVERGQRGSSPDVETSPLLSRRADELALSDEWFSITPHRPNYILPATYNNNSDYSAYGALGEDFSDAEIKLQLSLKTLLWPNMWRNSSLWAAYTQQSYWQLYADSDASAPFRETNHEPELIWEVPVDFKILG